MFTTNPFKVYYLSTLENTEVIFHESESTYRISWNLDFGLPRPHVSERYVSGLLLHMCVHVWVCIYAIVCMWRSENRIVELIFFSHLYVGCGLKIR